MCIRDRDQPVVHRDGVYVITGGTGDLGLEVARWLAAREQVTIVLIGRTDWTDAARPESPHGLKIREYLAAIAAWGSRAQMYAGDVADRARICLLYTARCV